MCDKLTKFINNISKDLPNDYNLYNNGKKIIDANNRDYSLILSEFDIQIIHDYLNIGNYIISIDDYNKLSLESRHKYNKYKNIYLDLKHCYNEIINVINKLDNELDEKVDDKLNEKVDDNLNGKVYYKILKDKLFIFLSCILYGSSLETIASLQ